ncbi:hypothetical protein EMPS_mp15 (mitochondrion) [Entomortierella parvispora]|uniref:GIY-YIG domain-containing protein n=1 Tax=Entomortierella parvispora TaxID=205924 RepID=A0A8J9WT33_9FUNG|nr:hypothetical protein EMPS_mp15 [Entomortierella parvispora]
MENNTIFSPIVFYDNTNTDKSRILSENKGKTGIYQWTHKESGKIYIGSAVDLSSCLSKYYSPLNLKRLDNYISRALLVYTHSAFSLSIIEYIDITGLTKENARKLILSREQFYIDSLVPQYNILKVAGSSLGYNHSDESIALMKKIQKNIDRSGEKNPMFGRTGEKNPFYNRTHTAETIAKMKEINKGKIKSEEIRTKMSVSQKKINNLGENNPMFGKTGDLSPVSKKVYVYSSSSPSILCYEFLSILETAKYFNCSNTTISRYIKNGEVFQKEYILSFYPLI